MVSFAKSYTFCVLHWIKQLLIIFNSKYIYWAGNEFWYVVHNRPRKLSAHFNTHYHTQFDRFWLCIFQCRTFLWRSTRLNGRTAKRSRFNKNWRIWKYSQTKWKHNYSLTWAHTLLRWFSSLTRALSRNVCLTWYTRFVHNAHHKYDLIANSL